jgi:hypothetical protein
MMNEYEGKPKCLEKNLPLSVPQIPVNLGLHTEMQETVYGMAWPAIPFRM